jgi:hypothetical protein
MYTCVCGIDFVSFYNFPIGSWNGFEYVIIIVFHFIISLFCSSIVINTVIVTAGTFEP